ncbi:hypothetical protein BC828DRAFT_417677 [Blastocladiella britannica]|nr:hypothetical protein BC828DRAFT_417677 [Blastocladiella britannica]
MSFTSSTASATAKNQTLALLATVADARSTYGLRHDDHARYHRFCSRRVASLRKAAAIQSPQRRNRPYEPFRFSATDSAMTATYSRIHCLVLAFEAERYLAHASDLRASALVAESAPAKNRTRRAALKKFKLAATRAALLDAVVAGLARRALDQHQRQADDDDRMDTDEAAGGLTFHPTDIVEVRAYAKAVRARYLSESAQWKDALDAYLAAKTAYEALAQLASADPTHVALSAAAIDALEPQIRYCMYSLTKKGHDAAALADLIRDASKRSASAAADGDADGAALEREIDAILLAQATADLSIEASAATSVEVEDTGSDKGAALYFLGAPVRVPRGGNAELARTLAQAGELAAAAAALETASTTDRRQQVAATQALVSALMSAEKLAAKDVAATTKAARQVSASAAGDASVAADRVAAGIAYHRRVAAARRALGMAAARVAEADAIEGGAEADVAGVLPAGSLAAAGLDVGVTSTGTGRRSKRHHSAAAPTPSATAADGAKATKRLADAARLMDGARASLAELAAMPAVASHPAAAAAVEMALRQVAAQRLALMARGLLRTALLTGSEASVNAAAAAARAGQAELAAAAAITLPLTSAQLARIVPSLPLLDAAAAAVVANDLAARAGSALPRALAILGTSTGSAASLPVTLAPFSLDAATTKTGTTRVSSVLPLPVPAKPVFLDLAFGEIDFDGAAAVEPASKSAAAHAHRAAETKRTAAAPVTESQEEQVKEQQGITGWLGGLWGGRK